MFIIPLRRKTTIGFRETLFFAQRVPLSPMNDLQLVLRRQKKIQIAELFILLQPLKACADYNENFKSVFHEITFFKLRGQIIWTLLH